MSESSGFFVSSGHDRIYTPDWLAEFIKALVTTGAYNNELGVTAGNDMSVSVAYGRAWVKGYLYLNDGPATFRIATADASLSRKDAVMLRLDRALRKIHLTVIQGDYASTPVAPGVTRNSDIYDLKLAEVSVPAGTTQITQSLIKDCRLDNAVCGITVSAVQYISTASYMSSMEAQFLAWFDTVKGIMGEDEAGEIINLLLVHTGDKSNPHSVTAAQANAFPFDKVITTQAEFETLIASPNWLGAASVCFVGDGGGLKFNKSNGQGVKIPQTVKRIQGVNSAIIEVANFSYKNPTNRAALWYATPPETEDYTVFDLEVRCTGTGTSSGYGFCNCTQLVNCTGIGNGPGLGDSAGFSNCTRLTNCTGNGTGNGYGFYDCTQLTNCTGIGTSANTGGCGFYNCTQLTNCTGTGTNSNSGGYAGSGFSNCTQLTNCTGTANGTGASKGNDGNGFISCTQLTNCTGNGNGSRDGVGFFDCTQLTNCTGSGISGSGTGYGFSACNYLNGCKQGKTASTTGFLGGTNKKVDNATVVAS